MDSPTHIEPTLPEVVPPNPTPGMPPQPSIFKRRKLIMVAGLALLLVAAVAAGILWYMRQNPRADDQKESTSTNHNARQNQDAPDVADDFVRAVFSADFATAMDYVSGTNVKEDNLRALVVMVAPTISSEPTRRGQDIQQIDGKERGVFVYEIKFDGEETGYAAVLLEKESTGWKVRNFSTAGTLPQADVRAYDPKLFESSPSSQVDLERKKDIKDLQHYIEAYYALNGFYPSLAQINDDAFRKTYVSKLDREAFKDPEGKSYLLARSQDESTPEHPVYAYEVGTANASECDNQTRKCQVYTLVAFLSDGTRYMEKNIN